jgi:calcium-dependent protein kinase
MGNSIISHASFFDDKDITAGFPFKKPNAQQREELDLPSIYGSPLLRQTNEEESLHDGIYLLHNSTICYYKNDSLKYVDSVLNVAYSQLREFSTKKGFAFSLTKNHVVQKFFSPQREIIKGWVNALKKVCVLTNLDEEYRSCKVIGAGNFAQVHLVESKTTKINFAAKVFPKKSLLAKAHAKVSLQNEIDMMRAIDHEAFVKFYEVYESETTICLVLEYVEGRTLSDILKTEEFNDTETRTIDVFAAILDGLTYLSSKGIMHRDLKPDNIILDKDNKVKIVDFGLASFIDIPEYILAKCGTPGFIPPEVFKFDEKNPTARYSDRYDLFSTGCILYYILFRVPFFNASKYSQTMKLNSDCTMNEQALAMIKEEIQDTNSKISKEALDLLEKLIEFDENKRISASDALNHSYLSSKSLPKVLGRVERSKSASSAFSTQRTSLGRISWNNNTPAQKVSIDQDSFNNNTPIIQRVSSYFSPPKSALSSSTESIDA